MRTGIVALILAAALALAPAAAAKGDTFVYVWDGVPGVLHVFTLDTQAGTLDTLEGSPFLGLDTLAPLNGWGMTLEAARLNNQALLFSGGALAVTMWTVGDDGVPVPQLVTGAPLLVPTAPSAGQATLRIGKRLFVYTSQNTTTGIRGFEFFVKGGPGFFTDLVGDTLTGDTGNTPIGIDAVKRRVVVADQSGTLSSFTLNASGQLTAAPGSPFPSPATGSYNCQLEPSAKRVYVADAGPLVHVLSVDKQGVLAPIENSPFDTGLLGGGAGVEVLKKPFVIAFDLDATTPGDPLVSVLRRNSAGQLALVGEPQVAPGMTAIDVHAVDSTATWLVVASDTDDHIQVLRLDLNAGTATQTDDIAVDFTDINGAAIVKP